MFSIPNPLTSITEEDIQNFLVHQVPEGVTIDYKRELYGNDDKGKKELLKDVSAFANKHGGDLIIGIEEKESIPVKIQGVSIDPDKEILRLESIIRSGLAPRLPRHECHHIKLSNGNYIIIIRIQRSWLAPHMVKESSRFYNRTSKGVYQMDVQEIRNAFIASETAFEKIRSFRDQRVQELIKNKSSLKQKMEERVILHLIPLSAFTPGQRYDVLTTNEPELKLRLQDNSSFSLAHRINMDGVLWYHPELTSNYAQIYHNGIIESVSQTLIAPKTIRGTDLSLIHPNIFENIIIQCVEEYLQRFKALNIPPPFVIFLTLTGVRGARMALSALETSSEIDRDMLLIPEIIIEDYTDSVSTALRPIINQVWNACGLLGSNNYDVNGTWSIT